MNMTPDDSQRQGDQSLGANQRVPVEFVLRLGHALDQCGYPADGLKEILTAVSTRLGLPRTETYTTATGFQMAFGPLSHQRTYLMAVRPGGLNLSRMILLDEVAVAVMEQRLDPATGIERVRAIQATGPAYPAPLTVIAYALASAAFARVLGGGLRETAVALLIGALTGLLALIAQRSDRVDRIFQPLAAFLASLVAASFAALVFPLASSLVTLAGLVVLLPGLTLTIALEELSTRHLVTGVGRLSAALITFLGVIFGVAIGGQLATRLAGPVHSAAPVALPLWTVYAAVGVSALASAVILNARPRDIGWIILATFIAFIVGTFGGVFSSAIGAFLGAFAVGVAANLFSTLRNRPALLMEAPGLIILVPGVIGYQSLASLLHADTLSGVQAGFQMFLIGVALVYGLLFANILSPDRTAPSLIASAYRRVNRALGKR